MNRTKNRNGNATRRTTSNRSLKNHRTNPNGSGNHRRTSRSGNHTTMNGNHTTKSRNPSHTTTHTATATHRTNPNRTNHASRTSTTRQTRRRRNRHHPSRPNRRRIHRSPSWRAYAPRRLHGVSNQSANPESRRGTGWASYRRLGPHWERTAARVTYSLCLARVMPT